MTPQPTKKAAATIIAVIFSTPLFSGCTTAELLAARQSMGPPINSYTPQYGAAPSYQSQKIMVFGGTDHKTYLGCLSCSEYSSESVFNQYGNYGSAYSNTSITNPYSQFGSQYSATGACNPYASDPPAVVDQLGDFLGYLTLNEYKSGAITNPNILAWLHRVCATQ